MRQGAQMTFTNSLPFVAISSAECRVQCVEIKLLILCTLHFTLCTGLKPLSLTNGFNPFDYNRKKKRVQSSGYRVRRVTGLHPVTLW